jgi:predicted Zn-dependent protease
MLTRSRATKVLLAAALGAGALLATGCSDGLGGVLISNAKELEMGRGVDLEIEKQYLVVADADPVAVWAREVVGGLVAGSATFRDPAEIDGYKVEVLYNDEEINAFAAPGGFTYITTGLITQATSCGEIAGVMSHELAHVTERHGVKQIEGNFAASEILGFFLGDGLANDAGSVIWAFLQNTQFSQEHESEADEVGLQIAFNAGYNPYALAEFFQKLVDLEASNPVQLPAFLSSHPASEARVAAVSAKIEALYGDQVQPGTTQTYGCVGTSLPLDQVKALIASGQLTVRPGTGAGAGAPQP